MSVRSTRTNYEDIPSPIREREEEIARPKGKYTPQIEKEEEPVEIDQDHGQEEYGQEPIEKEEGQGDEAEKTEIETNKAKSRTKKDSEPKAKGKKAKNVEAKEKPKGKKRARDGEEEEVGR
jgi:hypothetical protein